MHKLIILRGNSGSGKTTVAKALQEKFGRNTMLMSTYLNCLFNHGFIIEQVVEESAYDPEEADNFQEGKYYSAGLARLLNNVIIIKARKR